MSPVVLSWLNINVGVLITDFTLWCSEERRSHSYRNKSFECRLCLSRCPHCERVKRHICDACGLRFQLGRSVKGHMCTHGRGNSSYVICVDYGFHKVIV